jgi:hypothetical protein
MESEPEDELKQPVQKLLQKQHASPPKIQTNDDFSEQPTIDRTQKHHKTKITKAQYSNEKVKQKSNYDNIEASRPVEQAKVIDEHSSSISHKPDIAATKTKPFKTRGTPKKTPQKRNLVEDDPSITGSNDSPASRKSVNRRADAPKPITRELEKPKKKFQINKFEDSDVRALSNTQSFDVQQESLGRTNNQHIRKSMNNLKFNENTSSKESSESNYMRSVSKQSTHSNTNKQPIKPPMNNSSSQSSLSKMSNIIDSSSKNTIAPKMSNFGMDDSQRHETIKTEKQTTKPLIGKPTSQEGHSPKFQKSVDPNIIKPNLTQSVSNSVHQSIEYTKPTPKPEVKRQEEERPEPFVHPQSIKIEKEDSSSEEEQQDEDNTSDDHNQEESDEEEFPVALNRLVFSFLPQDVAESLNDQEDWKKRTTAIQKMETLMKKQLNNPNDDFPIYITDICNKMCKMMHDSNFKISLTSLRILHITCTKYPKEVSECLNNLVNNLSEKLSDNKIVIRHAVLKVFYTLLTSLGPNDIIDLVFPFLDNENWHIREEILSILIMGCITSNSTCGLSDPKLLGQVCQMINDDNKKVCNAALETLCVILSKDSSTAIILNSYLDPQIYNTISERCSMGILANVNYDGIVEFPTSHSANSNSNVMYRSSFSQNDEAESVQDGNEMRKHTQSVDQTYHSNQQPQQHMQADRNNKYSSAIEFEKTNSTTQSIGNKHWLPAFNMTASSIQSKQSVRVSQEPYMQTPNQNMNKGSNVHERNHGDVYDHKINYTPEAHQAKPRNFSNVENPSMTTHSMNVAPNPNNMMQQHATDSTRSNTFYSKETMSKNGNQNISDKLKILKSSAKMRPNNSTHSPISQNNYNEQVSSHKISTLSDYHDFR